MQWNGNQAPAIRPGNGCPVPPTPLLPIITYINFYMRVDIEIFNPINRSKIL
jgi:hypothetical protein